MQLSFASCMTWSLKYRKIIPREPANMIFVHLRLMGWNRFDYAGVLKGM
jgi:hypothetical protein